MRVPSHRRQELVEGRLRRAQLAQETVVPHQQERAHLARSALAQTA
jgi:hypothetical protein